MNNSYIAAVACLITGEYLIQSRPKSPRKYSLQCSPDCPQQMYPTKTAVIKLKTLWMIIYNLFGTLAHSAEFLGPGKHDVLVGCQFWSKIFLYLVRLYINSWWWWLGGCRGRVVIYSWYIWRWLSLEVKMSIKYQWYDSCVYWISVAFSNLQCHK